MSSQDFWSKYLDSPTLSVMPHDFLRPTGGQQKGAVLKSKLEANFTTGLAAFAALVFRLSGDDDIVIATNSCNSNSDSTFVVRVNVSATTTFGELKQAISQQYANNSQKPTNLSELAWDLKRTKELDELPELFRLTFAVYNEQSSLESNVQGSKNDIAIYFDEQSQDIHFFYNALLYTEERITILSEQLNSIVKTPESSPITSVSLITSSQASLPSPTSDLDWCGYKGAIHDIFDANAKRHPQRTCVVETASPLDASSKSRTFNYQQINEASNVVAHYLVSNGIEVGDIVMLYSHRSVDLVVAVMGVLKAGGTFSVIDPAYPPARQNIYLSVAKPRGLIVLERAGVLDELVEDYIKNDLQLKTRLDSLKISDEGEVVAANKALGSFQKIRQDQPQGIIIGPDNNPTLSFTSGSEGIPKGVLGRHYSLAYYFEWMSQRFNINQDDKFTMLSGIAHDPIQRDMFTPLFLGAQLLVPTQDDIGTPGRLAEWMAEHKASVTHLTPAMGQLLSAQATASIPSLHHAFFVGDILTKRDCLRLQTLAENVRIVNMYGTTETQRSVSYYELPSRAEKPEALKFFKDVVPAGSGMQNVQLLVVNRHEKTRPMSGVGEIGEIYVRAAGMAEGYRGLPELNAEKFVSNWFVNHKWEDTYSGKGKWEGPRDRLYRTGDLGRYLPDGNVECCGRADDQVKIRGFRIELGEIDTHISQHSAIRENVTLVRKNDGESVLISFIVPKDQSLFVEEGDKVVEGVVRYSNLIKDLKAYLRKRLASYAIPSFIVPISSLPLNPNGKVDKPKLQLPTTTQMEAISLRTDDGPNEDLSPLEQQIKEIWHEVLPNKPAIGKEDSFFDVGGHSILATRMIFAVRKQLEIDLPLGIIFKKPTLGAFANEVKKVKDGENDISSSALNANDVSKNNYAEDGQKLIAKLPASYKTSTELEDAKTFFLTGATGFLGTFILRDLLNRSGTKVMCHVRAKDAKLAMERLRKTGKTYGIWDEEWTSRIEITLGDLAKPKFGLSDETWADIASRVDAIIHNGALVHWVYPYAQLRDANVIGTLNVMSLCETGKPKKFTFVSSTSVLDTDHYFDLSDKLVAQGKAGILESDDLQGSSTGLSGGYGQSKWVGELLVREAGKRGLNGTIVRPGYVTGYSKTGAANTDDFLLRMLKGCVELGFYPDISNTVNMVPVDHVARVTVATTLSPPTSNGVSVAQVTGHPRKTFSEYVGSLANYGYKVEKITYDQWKSKLQKFVEDGNDSALFPLLHMVLDNLPKNSLAPELDDRNATKSLLEDAKRPGQEDASKGRGMSLEQFGVYIAYLVKIGFLPQTNTELPAINISDETLELVASGAGARGSAAK